MNARVRYSVAIRSQDQILEAQLNLTQTRMAAGRMAEALKDIYNLVGEIPEVKKHYLRVQDDVEQFEGAGY